MNRCFGNNDTLYSEYHDKEWGIEVHDDKKLFEMLILEGAQAGLSWITILKKREEYKRVFYDFDPYLIERMSDEELNNIISSSNVVRNKLKIYSVRKNAKVFIELVNKYGSFDKYIWSYIDGKQIVNSFNDWKEVPTYNETSVNMSKNLKKLGMNFVGPTIMYSFMQAIGMIDDHLLNCWKREGNDGKD